MRNFLLGPFFLLFFSATVWAQKPIVSSVTDRCGSVFDEAKVRRNSPSNYQRWLALEQQVKDYQRTRTQTGGNSPGQRVTDPAVTVTIPVVVRVLFNTPNQNISDAQIQSQIAVLNEDYRRLNADRARTPAQFLGLASDVNIEFKLACIDPAGNPTTGIIRVSTTRTGFDVIPAADGTVDDVASGIKYVPGAAPWPSDRYLNIWTCNFNDTRNLGYATFPWQQSPVDGIVLAYNATGRTGTLQARFNKGRTATHEVGHWLNLFHIWGDDAGACTGTDEVADTPNQANSNSGCPGFPIVTCSNQGDMSMNYMDYTDDACMNLFTNGQKDRMRTLFAAGGFRESFISAKIQEQLSQVCSGPVTFSVVANQGAAVTYNWTVTGALQLASGQGSNRITCNQNGTGTATITVSANGYCDSKTIQVGPLSTTDIIGMDPSNYFSAGQTITLSVNESALGYNWAIYGGTIIGSSTEQSVTVRLDGCFSGQNANNDFDANVTLTDGCGVSNVYHEHTYAKCDGLSPIELTSAPNPTSGPVEVFLSEKGNMKEKKAIQEIKILDNTGNIRYEAKYEGGRKSILLDVSSFPKSIYIISAFDGKNWIYSRLVKE